ncbi:MAG: hypothetical protein U9O24_03030 [Campylobacterota bacterium]|nr:hypothetical protein [Campylobacterota bacterium]
MDTEIKKIVTDIISKQADIVYKKMLVFSAVAGGSWIYGIKIGGYLGFFIWIVFLFAVLGVVVNLSKHGTLYRELEDIKNG